MLGPRLDQADPPASRGGTANEGENTGSAQNISITDLHLHGNTNHTGYPCSIPSPSNASIPYYVCEHNALILFLTKAPGVLRDITVQRVVVEAIGGDCMDFGWGVQNLLVEDVQLRDYLRQGVDLAGNTLSRNHTVRRVTELPWKTVTKPGGSTIHVEEATGLRDVMIADSVCNHSILASSAINLTIMNNTVVGVIEGNFNTQMNIRGNTIIATGNTSMAMFLAAQTAAIVGNTFLSAALPGSAGIYVWGHDENYPSATNITIASNTFIGQFASQGKTVQLYGVDGVRIEDNHYQRGPPGSTAKERTCECCRNPAKIPELCVDVSIKTDDDNDLKRGDGKGAKIALYYSGWQLVGQREDQPTAGDVNNVSRVKELLARGFTHGMLSHGNDATIGDHRVVTYGSNCSGWTPASRTCAARFLFENGMASYMTVGLNFHRFYEDPASIPMPLRRQHSPFVNRTYHLLTMKQLTDNLRALSPWLGGVANDLEYGCWPPNLGIGNATAEQFKFPDLPERLGNAPSAMGDRGYPSFTNWPITKAHPRPHDLDWTLEQLMYNMPKKILNVTTPDVQHHDTPVVRVSGSPGGNTTMFGQVFSPAKTQRLTRVDLWLRLSAAAALPAMPYISYFIAPLKSDGSPDVDNPIQCAIPRPKNRVGGKWIKCGVSAKELPVAPPSTGNSSGSSSDLMDEWQPMKLYFNPEETVLERGKQYALILENCPLDTCWLAVSHIAPNNIRAVGLDLLWPLTVSVANAQGSSEKQVGGSTVDYEIAIHHGDTPSPAGAMVFVGGAWQTLPGAAATSILYEPGSIAHGYSPNQLHAVRYTPYSYVCAELRLTAETGALNNSMLCCLLGAWIRTGLDFTRTSLRLRSRRWLRLLRQFLHATSLAAKTRHST